MPFYPGLTTPHHEGGIVVSTEGHFSFRHGGPEHPAVLDFFDPAKSRIRLLVNPEPSNRIEYCHVKRQACWDGQSVPYRFGLPPIDLPWAALEDQLAAARETGTFFTYAYHNLYWLHWYLGLSSNEGKLQIFHARREPLLERTYSMFVAWNDGSVSSEDVRIATDSGGGFTARSTSRNDTDISAKIRMAVFGSRLVHNGKKVPVSNLAAQFSDHFQLFQFPQFIEKTRDGSFRYGEAIGPSEMAEGPEFPNIPEDRPRLHRALKNDGYVEINLAPYLTRHKTMESIEEKFLRRPLLNGRTYHRVEACAAEGLKPGDYYIKEDILFTKLYSFPYPHNLIGVTRSGRTVTVVLIGDKNRGIGDPVQTVADRVIALCKEAGDKIESLHLLANSRDVMRRKNGACTDKSGPEIYKLTSGAITISLFGDDPEHHASPGGS